MECSLTDDELDEEEKDIDNKKERYSCGARHGHGASLTDHVTLTQHARAGVFGVCFVIMPCGKALR
jgi:hypothetical protein